MDDPSRSFSCWLLIGNEGCFTVISWFWFSRAMTLMVYLCDDLSRCALFLALNLVDVALSYVLLVVLCCSAR